MQFWALAERRRADTHGGTWLPPSRFIVESAFSDDFKPWGALALSPVWTLVLVLAVLSVLGRLEDRGSGTRIGGRLKPSRSLS